MGGERFAGRDAGYADLTRWQVIVKELDGSIAAKIAFVADRHNRTGGESLSRWPCVSVRHCSQKLVT